ncbi:hypothetical protein [Nonomuraea insulae]
MSCGATRKIVLASGTGKRMVNFWHRDARGPKHPAGYHIKQLLLNGKVVWERDVAADTADTWVKATVENAAVWTPVLARQGGAVYCSAQVYHENYGADLGARIAKLYAAK